MTNEEILANAPDGATHVDEEGFFWILEFNRRVCFGTTSERKVTNSYVYRSLSDIRRIVELEKANSKLNREKSELWRTAIFGKVA